MQSLLFQGIPSFFRACCREAAQRMSGLDYANPGYQLVLHLADRVPHGAERGDWMQELSYLDKLFEDGELDPALRWFTEHFPKCMRLVPRRRRKKFIEGAYSCWQSGSG